MGKTTIQVDIEIKNKLERLKIHPREPFSDVIARLLEDEDVQTILTQVQKEKMMELWDNQEDEVWNDA